MKHALSIASATDGWSENVLVASELVLCRRMMVCVACTPPVGLQGPNTRTQSIGLVYNEFVAHHLTSPRVRLCQSLAMYVYRQEFGQPLLLPVPLAAEYCRRVNLANEDFQQYTSCLLRHEFGCSAVVMIRCLECTKCSAGQVEKPLTRGKLAGGIETPCTATARRLQRHSKRQRGRVNAPRGR